MICLRGDRTRAILDKILIVIVSSIFVKGILRIVRAWIGWFCGKGGMPPAGIFLDR